LVPEKREIMSVISREYSVSLDELKLTRGEHKNEARDVAIYFMRRLRCDILNTLCGELNLKKDSSVGIIVDRVKKQIKTDKRFRVRIKDILRKLNMSYWVICPS